MELNDFIVRFLVAVLISGLFAGWMPAYIASKKGRAFRVWWVYGTLVYVIALLHSLLIDSKQCVTRRLEFCFIFLAGLGAVTIPPALLVLSQLFAITSPQPIEEINYLYPGRLKFNRESLFELHAPIIVFLMIAAYLASLFLVLNAVNKRYVMRNWVLVIIGIAYLAIWPMSLWLLGTLHIALAT